MAVQDRQSEAEPLRVGRGWVRREPLFERLGHAAAGGVVLVSSPAGSGKTVLLRSWVHAALGLELRRTAPTIVESLRATSTPSSTPTAALRPSSALASWACSPRPRACADLKIIGNR